MRGAARHSNRSCRARKGGPPPAGFAEKNPTFECRAAPGLPRGEASTRATLRVAVIQLTARLRTINRESSASAILRIATGSAKFSAQSSAEISLRMSYFAGRRQRGTQRAPPRVAAARALRRSAVSQLTDQFSGARPEKIAPPNSLWPRALAIHSILRSAK